MLTISVSKALRSLNPRKAVGPDNIPEHTLRFYSSEVAEVLADIYNLSLAQVYVPTFFKSTTTVPLQKKSTATCLNDYWPIALTPIVMKCFEKIVMANIKDIIPDTLEPPQFA